MRERKGELVSEGAGESKLKHLQTERERHSKFEKCTREKVRAIEDKFVEYAMFD